MAFDFNFNNFGDNVKIIIDDDNQAQCPECNCKFKRLLQHLQNSPSCKSKIDNFEDFRQEYQVFTNRRRQINYRNKKLEQNAEEMHRTEASKKRNERKRKLESNAEETHKVEATKKRNQRERKLESNAEEFHKVEATKKKKSKNWPN